MTGVFRSPNQTRYENVTQDKVKVDTYETRCFDKFRQTGATNTSLKTHLNLRCKICDPMKN